MKKYYFMVLIALLAFSLNAKAQDATGQDETNNRMTVKMNDGTSFILNTDNVAEITFGDGVPAFSAQNIAKALAALDELGQYVNRLEALEQSDVVLMNHVTALEATATETQMHIIVNRDLIQQVQKETAEHNARLAALENRIVTVDGMINQLQADNDALKATLADESDKNNNQQAQINAMHAYMAQLETEIQNLQAQIASMQQ